MIHHPDFSRRHAIHFLVVGFIELFAVVVSAKVFGFAVVDVMLLKVDAAGLIVIGGYMFLVIGILLLFKDE